MTVINKENHMMLPIKDVISEDTVMLSLFFNNCENKLSEPSGEKA
jgi:hypothetical protein